MRKIFLLLGLLVLTATTTFAFTMPRWGYFPIKVYIPDCNEAEIINTALMEWSAKSGGILSFKPSKSKTSAQLVFKIVDDATEIGKTDIHNATTYLFKVDVTLSRNIDGIPVKPKVFKSAVLHEIANAMAIKSTDKEENITYNDFYADNKYPEEITDEDVAAFNRTYRETSIRENITKKYHNNTEE